MTETPLPPLSSCPSSIPYSRHRPSLLPPRPCSLSQLPSRVAERVAVRQELLAQHEALQAQLGGLAEAAAAEVRMLARMCQLANKMEAVGEPAAYSARIRRVREAREGLDLRLAARLELMDRFAKVRHRGDWTTLKSGGNFATNRSKSGKEGQTRVTLGGSLRSALENFNCTGLKIFEQCGSAMSQGAHLKALRILSMARPAVVPPAAAVSLVIAGARVQAPVPCAGQLTCCRRLLCAGGVDDRD